MLEMLSHSFVQRALLVGLMVALVCPAVGLFLVLRRLAQYGDTLAHLSLVGVAAGVLVKFYPVGTGLAFSVAASLGMDWLRQRYAKYSELSLAIMAPTALALAVMLMTATGGSGADVMGYLFGSIMTVAREDVWLIVALGLAVLTILGLLHKELVAVAFDEDLARIGGLPVAWVNTIFMALTAVTVAMAMSAVGVLLVAALMVIPVAAALAMARSFKGALVWALLVGVASVLLGITLSYQLNLMPGATVALTAVAVLGLILLYKRVSGQE